MEDGEEWFDDEDVPELLRAKVQALKACRSRCLAHASSDKAIEIATPVMKMYATLLEHSGSLNSEIQEEWVPPFFIVSSLFLMRTGVCSPKFMSRLRLQAAVSMLHLSTVEKFATVLTPKFLRLAVVIQVGFHRSLPAFWSLTVGWVV